MMLRNNNRISRLDPSRKLNICYYPGLFLFMRVYRFKIASIVNFFDTFSIEKFYVFKFFILIETKIEMLKSKQLKKCY